MNTADTFYREAISHLARTPPDFEAAVPLLRQAAQAGHAESAFQLAGCLLQGLGISADRQAGIRLMQQEAGILMLDTICSRFKNHKACLSIH